MTQFLFVGHGEADYGMCHRGGWQFIVKMDVSKAPCLVEECG